MRYERQEKGDKEARLTKELDKFDMVVQAMEYEEKKRPKGASPKFLQDFFDSTENYFKNTSIRSWDQALRDLRKQRINWISKVLKSISKVVNYDKDIVHK